ncbi:MAG: transcriptional repressor NrdR [Ruminococcaceae bacterium]|nr:transcriptional repressor NrdR [Oscillospiraceae bacterium]
MKCPSCGHIESKVLDSRPINDNASIRRRRECLVCQRRFTTYEVIDNIQLTVVKKDGTKEFFDRRKIASGILKACHKRPVDAEALATEVESELTNSLRGEVTSDEIGKTVLQKLRKLDAVSYIRYASVYRDFDDIKSFLDELETINNNK